VFVPQLPQNFTPSKILAPQFMQKTYFSCTVAGGWSGVAISGSAFEFSSVIIGAGVGGMFAAVIIGAVADVMFSAAVTGAGVGGIFSIAISGAAFAFSSVCTACPQFEQNISPSVMIEPQFVQKTLLSCTVAGGWSGVAIIGSAVFVLLS
jgi:predicted ester cyclase